MLSMGSGYGFNTNIIETNVLNLRVVLGIVVTVVGEGFSSLLYERREALSLSWSDLATKTRKTIQRLETAGDVVARA
jgi:hypothetical protein